MLDSILRFGVTFVQTWNASVVTVNKKRLETDRANLKESRLKVKKDNENFRAQQKLRAQEKKESAASTLASKALAPKKPDFKTTSAKVVDPQAVANAQLRKSNAQVNCTAAQEQDTAYQRGELSASPVDTAHTLRLAKMELTAAKKSLTRATKAAPGYIATAAVVVHATAVLDTGMPVLADVAVAPMDAVPAPSAGALAVAPVSAWNTGGNWGVPAPSAPVLAVNQEVPSA